MAAYSSILSTRVGLRTKMQIGSLLDRFLAAVRIYEEISIPQRPRWVKGSTALLRAVRREVVTRTTYRTGRLNGNDGEYSVSFGVE